MNNLDRLLDKLERAHFQPEIEEPFPLTPHQESVMLNILGEMREGKKKHILRGSAGVGKMQPYTEPILTPDGWKTMREIQPNSMVISPTTGLPIKVIQTFHHNNLSIYKVTFDDGTFVECCNDHLWKVNTKKTTKIVDVNYMLRTGIKGKDNGKFVNKYSVDLISPVEFTVKPISLDPYFLGLLLGDGYLPSEKNWQVTMAIHSDDSENLFTFLTTTGKIPHDVVVRVDKQYYDNIHVKRHVFSTHLKPYLSDLGLLGKKSADKFIPINYLYNTIEVRKALLAGLLDTDGHCDLSGERKHVSFSTTSIFLRDGIIELVRSLGGQASYSISNRKNKSIEYKVSIRTSFNPFIRRRKREAFDKIPFYYKWRKYITDISYIRQDCGQCILVDSSDHLYITRDYTATHNTFLVRYLVKKFRKEIKPYGGVYITAPTNRAVAVLQDKEEHPPYYMEFKTIHSTLYLKRKINDKTGEITFVPDYNPKKERPLKGVSLLIVDEASMLNSELLYYLEDPLYDDTFMLFLGDEKQLNPVGEEDSPIFLSADKRGENRKIAIAGEIHTRPIPAYYEYELTEIIRQKVGNPIIDLSYNLSNIGLLEDNLNVEGHGYEYSSDFQKMLDMIISYGDDIRYLAWTNNEVDNTNSVVRKLIYGPHPHKVEPNEAIIFGEPYEGIDEKAYYTNYELKINQLEVRTSKFVPIKSFRLNDGQQTDIIDIEADLTYYLLNKSVRIIHEESYYRFLDMVKQIKHLTKFGLSWKAYYAFTEQFARFSYRYALTVHKSQGGTFDRVIINMKDLNRNRSIKEKNRLWYTALTRAAKNVIIYNAPFNEAGSYLRH